jgi:hypothetical protein
MAEKLLLRWVIRRRFKISYNIYLITIINIKTFDELTVVYEDNELISGRNPEAPEEYGINLKNTDNYLILPRGCLKDIALANRNSGRTIIDQLGPYDIENFFKEGLNYDSLIAVIDKTYMIEEKRRQGHLMRR